MHVEIEFLPWIYFLKTAQMIDFLRNNCYCHFVYIQLPLYADNRMVVFFCSTDCNRKYRILFIWLTCNIIPQKSLVKLLLSGLEVGLNPIKVKFKPTFIINIFPFKFIHIFWSIIFSFYKLNFPESNIF